MSFKTINTQEELDEVLKDRLHRAEEKYSNYTSPEDLEKIKSEYDSQLATIRAENATLRTGALKSAIATEMNIPASLASRIQGSTEDEIRKDAQVLADAFKAQQPVLPLSGQDTATGKSNTSSALRELAQQLTNN